MLTTDVFGDGAQRHDFFEPKLRFGIRRPPGWRFLAAGGPARRRNAQATPPPFVAMVRDVPSGRHPRPTVQVSCRRDAAGTAGLRPLLAAHLEILARELDDFEPLAFSLDNIVGGRRAADLQYRYTLHLPRRTESCPAPVLAHNYLIPGTGLLFTIAMSSSEDPRYYDEGDFAVALASVRIGSPARRNSGLTFERPRVIGWTGTPGVRLSS
jgi:hypothetical protein